MDQAQAIALVNNPNGSGPRVTDTARVNSTQVAAGVTHAVGCASSGQTLYYPDGTTATPGSSGSSGTVAAMLATTPTLGATWVATDLNNIEFIGKTSPAATVVWAPRGGRQPWYNRSGSIATPLVSIAAGSTAATFTIPGGVPIVPANLLVANMSRFAVRTHFKRGGSTATMTLNLRFGTNGTTADNTFYNMNVTVVNGELRGDTAFGISGATTYTALFTLPVNTIASPVAVDRTTAFAVASPNIFTFDFSGANVADGPFSIISLEIDLVG